MRLIDADATVQEIRRIEKIAEKRVENTDIANKVYQRYLGEWHAIRRMRMLVDRAPHVLLTSITNRDERKKRNGRKIF